MTFSNLGEENGSILMDLILFDDSLEKKTDFLNLLNLAALLNEENCKN